MSPIRKIHKFQSQSCSKSRYQLALKIGCGWCSRHWFEHLVWVARFSARNRTSLVWLEGPSARKKPRNYALRSLRARGELTARAPEEHRFRQIHLVGRAGAGVRWHWGEIAPCDLKISPSKKKIPKKYAELTSDVTCTPKIPEIICNKIVNS